MNKILVALGLILGIGGIIFSLLPPNIHMVIFGGDIEQNDMEKIDMQNMGMEGMDMHEDMQHDHGKFVTYGLVIAVIGFALAFAGWKIFS